MLKRRGTKITAVRGLQIPILPANTAVSSFCRNLSSNRSQAVIHAVTEITQLKNGMIVNMLAIGERLSKLRLIVGPEKFSEFMTKLLPTLGVSRSTGYRWLAFADNLAQLFPNPLVRQHLMSLTDGRGIVTRSRELSNDRSPTITLTPAAERALDAVPRTPGNEQGQFKAEEWVRQFIRAIAKARAQLRTPRHNVVRDQEVILRYFSRFAACYGPTAAETLCGLLDKALNHMVDNTAYSGRAAIKS